MVMAINDRTSFANENLRVRRAWQSQNEAEGKRGRRHRCWNHSTQHYFHEHLLVRIANIALYLEIRRFCYFDSSIEYKNELNDRANPVRTRGYTAWGSNEQLRSFPKRAKPDH